MPAGAGRLWWRADAVPAFKPEELFNCAIFQRVKTYNRQSATRTEGLQSQGQNFFQSLQLTIDGDAQGLESLRSRVV